MLVHRTNIDAHETEFAVQKLREQIGEFVYPVHRLDKASSGLLLFAKKAEYVSNLQAAMQSDSCQKFYVALVRGWLGSAQKIDYPLANPEKKRGKNRESSQEQKKEAISFVWPLKNWEIEESVDKFPSTRFSLVLVQIKTGRTHQIRRHLRHIGHPIIGDANYGVGKYNRFFRENLGLDFLFLRSIFLRLSIENFGFTEPVDIAAGFNEDWSKFFKQFPCDLSLIDKVLLDVLKTKT